MLSKEYFIKFMQESGIPWYYGFANNKGSGAVGDAIYYAIKDFDKAYPKIWKSKYPLLLIMHSGKILALSKGLPQKEESELTSYNFKSDSDASAKEQFDSVILPLMSEFPGGGGTPGADTQIKPNGEVSYLINPFVPGWGLTGTCEFIAKDGTKVTFKGDGKFDMEENERTDLYERSDFRYGIWYYNVLELFKYAEAKDKPVFIDYGSAGCGPCSDFKEEVFSNSGFQEWVKTKRILLGRYDEESGFNQYDINAQNTLFPPERRNGYPPHMIFRWKSKGIHVDLRYDPDKTMPGDITSMNEVSSLIQKYLGGNEGDTSLLPPEITSFNSSGSVECPEGNCEISYVKLQVYDGANDLSGKFYTCYNKRNTANSFTISAYNKTKFDRQITVKYGEPISVEDTDVVPNRMQENKVYKYTTSNESEGDRNGIIFSVGKIESSSQRIFNGKWPGIDWAHIEENYDISVDD